MKILIATDGSDYSFMAVEKACDMVIKPASSNIRIISVYQDLVSMAAEPLEISAEEVLKLENIGRLQSTDYALKAEQIIKQRFPDEKIKISMSTVKGSAKYKILEEAEKWNADLIVVGSLGHNFLSRFFLGSVSDAIVKHAKCSILVIRGKMEETDN
jgi:nucleotide-binding universal stress UspA family protein